MPSVLWILLDGAGDRPLGGKTPLHVALKPAIDHLASQGSCGLLHPISPGVRPGSDTAHLALFGYDPYKYYTGRGAFEALGAGLELRPGDVAFRTNLATVDESGVVVDRRAGRAVSEEEAAAVEALMREVGAEVARKHGVEVVYRSTVEHRGVLVLRGPVSHRVSDTDPHRTGARVQPARPLEESRESLLTADVINEIARLFAERARALEINKRRAGRGMPPINAILVRGGGYMPEIEPLRQRYSIRAAAIAGVALVRGVARAVGMDVYTAPGLRGIRDDTYDEAVKLAAGLLGNYNVVFLHVKGTDSAGHDGDFSGKVSVIERLDRALEPHLDRLLGHYVLVTADHATPVTVREHTGEPVPIALYGPDVVTDDVHKLSELACWRGALGHLRGTDIMPLLGSYLALTGKFGE